MAGSLPANAAHATEAAALQALHKKGVTARWRPFSISGRGHHPLHSISALSKIEWRKINATFH